MPPEKKPDFPARNQLMRSVQESNGYMLKSIC